MSLEGTAEATNEIKGRIYAVPQADETLTKEGYAADAKVTGDELKERVKKADIVDNLTTEDSERPLSAKQGAELKKLIDELAGRL